MFRLAAKDYPLTRPRFSFDASPAGEELAQLARRLATGEHTAEDLDRLRELPREDHEELKRLVARVRETEDRRRTARDTEREAGERRDPIDNLPPGSTYSATQHVARPEAVREARAMDAAIARLRADGFGHLAFDQASSAAGCFALACKEIGVDLRGVDPAAWESIYKARRRGATAPAMDARASRGFFDRYPGARNVRVADYNDLGGR